MMRMNIWKGLKKQKKIWKNEKKGVDRTVWLCNNGGMIGCSKTFFTSRVCQSNTLINKNIFVMGGGYC